MANTDTFSAQDLRDLELARELLENPGLAVKITNTVGAPIEAGLDMLPDSARQLIASATQKSLQRALELAVSTLGGAPQQVSNNWVHKLAVAATGAAGGALGLAALAIELPVSTTIMLRSIADVARSEGELVKTAESQLACLEVFALGGARREDDAAESGYFLVRASLAKAMAEAAEYLTGRGVAKEGVPVLVRFVAQIAERFGVTVGEKVVAQAVPVVGALGGAALNTMFLDHFQNVARGHFIVRRLERRYGAAIVRQQYESA